MMDHSKRFELAEILIGMYNEDKVGDHNKIEWHDICQDATSEIENNLFLLTSNEQRLGYLCTTFNHFFQHGIGYSLAEIDTNLFDASDDDSFRYACQCRWVMNWIVYEISRAAIYYDGLSFLEVARHANIPEGLVFEISSRDADKRNSQDDASLFGKLSEQTAEKYLEYVEFYIKERKRNNRNKIGAVKSTIAYFDISEKTLSRATNYYKLMMDLYQLKE